MTSLWDNPDLKTGETYLSLKEVGDKVENAEVAEVGFHYYEPGQATPQLHLVDYAGNSLGILTCGTINLKRLMKDNQVMPGDRIKRLELVRIESRPGGKTLKHYELDLDRPVAAAPSAAAGGDDPAPAGTDPAVWAGLSEEKRDKVRAAAS